MEQHELLQELLNLSAKKEIPYTAAQLKKMSDDKLEQVMAEYKQKELDSMHEILVDLALGKFEEIMKSFSLIKQESTLARNLQERKLFRNDLKSIIASITPLLPYIGILEGLVVTGAEVFDNIQESNKNESASSQAKEGEESYQTSATTDSDTT